MAGANKKWTVLCCWAMLPICIVSAKGAHHAAAAPAPAPAPAPTAAIDCSSALVSLVDCLSFVQEGSREGKPQGQCCPGLKEVVKEEVSCLCQAFKGSADYGVKLNMSRALTLPSACGVRTPPFSKCNIAIGGCTWGSTCVIPSRNTSSFFIHRTKHCESSGHVPSAFSSSKFPGTIAYSSTHHSSNFIL